MNSEQIITNLINQGEGIHLEFKSRFNKIDIGKAICAFLNSDGGQLIVGVTSKKKIVGIDDGQVKQAEIQKFLFHEIMPEAPVMVSLENVANKEILSIKVWRGSKQPYVFNGSIFFRRNDQTSRATSREISDLIHKRTEAEIHWERQPVVGAELDDLDGDEIQKTIDAASIYNRNDGPSQTFLDFLSYYGLFRNGSLTNAAIVLFAKNPARFIPQVRVRLALLTLGKTAGQFRDDQFLDGNLFRNIEAIQAFLLKHLSTTRTFSDTQWKRTDEMALPQSALREGVMNALVHREYGLISSSASIIIYSRTLEILNTGKSPLSQAELKRNHPSVPHNPDIAHIVFLRGYIEKIGRGTLKIIEACKQARLKPPTWGIGEKTVKLTFYSRTRLVGEVANVYENNRDKGLIEGPNKGAIEGAIEGATKGATRALKSKLTMLLYSIWKNEGKRVPDYKLDTGWTTSTIERYLRQLKNAGLVEFKGNAAQTGGYYLSPRMKAKLK